MDIYKFPPNVVQQARESVANEWCRNARAIRLEDNYADHVSEETKDENLRRGLKIAEDCRSGKLDGSFTFRQRIWAALTGEWVPLLPKN